MAIAPERIAAHHCHARGCTVKTKPEMLMCFKHWNRVPRKIQRAVWRTYRPGQCEDMSPSDQWHLAADAAIGAVALKEGKGLSRNEFLALLEAGYNEAGLENGQLLELPAREGR